MNAKKIKKEILHFIDNVDEEGLYRMYRFICDHFEVVATDSDKKVIARGEQEIKEGKFRRL